MVALTLIGIALRLARLDESLLGDEMSTLWIVDGNSLSYVFSTISSDAEISPPLYFILSWATTQLGSAPELVRLPALLAGVASIPLTYLVGARAIGPTVGLIASAVMALSPFMIFYSTDGRAYAVAILLLLLSTLAMLHAVETDRARWWVAYGLATLLAVYTHYTSAFVLGAQLLWLLWAHRESWRPALLSNGIAAVLFIPWIPNFLADSDSPTIEILSALQGDGLAVKLEAVEAWSIGFPYVDPADVPGRLWLVIAAVGLLAAAVAGLWRWWGSSRPGRPAISKGMVLVIALALATPLAETLILALGGTDLLGARNLNTSSPGLALAIGAILAAAGPVAGVVCTVGVLGAYAVSAGKTLDPDNGPVNAKAAAGFIDATGSPADVVVDAATSATTPVPLTPLDLYLPQTRREYRINLPGGEPPFLPSSAAPDPGQLLRQAFDDADGERLLYVTREGSVIDPSPEYPNGAVVVTPVAPGSAPYVFPIPDGFEIADRQSFRGFVPIEVVVIDSVG